MKKSVLFALPLVALVFAVACKKQEAAPAPAAEQPAAVQTPAPAATPAAAPAAQPAATPAPAAAPAKAPEKKGK